MARTAQRITLSRLSPTASGAAAIGVTVCSVVGFALWADRSSVPVPVVLCLAVIGLATGHLLSHRAQATVDRRAAAAPDIATIASARRRAWSWAPPGVFVLFGGAGVASALVDDPRLPTAVMLPLCLAIGVALMRSAWAVRVWELAQGWQIYNYTTRTDGRRVQSWARARTLGNFAPAPPMPLLTAEDAEAEIRSIRRGVALLMAFYGATFLFMLFELWALAATDVASHLAVQCPAPTRITAACLQVVTLRVDAISVNRSGQLPISTVGIDGAIYTARFNAPEVATLQPGDQVTTTVWSGNVIAVSVEGKSARSLEFDDISHLWLPAGFAIFLILFIPEEVWRLRRRGRRARPLEVP